MEEKNNQLPPNTEIKPVSFVSNKPLMVFGILSGLLVIAGAIIVGIQIGKKQTPKTPSEILFNQPTSVLVTPTPDPTANWKTYQNENYKIFFKYPLITVLVEEKDNKSANQFIVIFENPNFNLNILKVESKLDVKNYYLDFKSTESLSINSISWEVFLAPEGYCDAGECSPPFTAYKTRDDNYDYIFTFTGKAEKDPLHVRILSTFKFLDSSNAETKTQTAYLKNVYEKDGKRYVEVDYVEWFSGEEAIKAAMQDTGCPRETINYGSCAPSLNNGFYIRNLNPQIRTFMVANSAKISLNFSLPPDGGMGLQDISWNHLKEGFSTGEINNYLVGVRNGLFELIISSNNEISSLRQRYMP